MMDTWRAKRATHGNRAGQGTQAAVPVGTIVSTAVYFPMAERVTFWVNATAEQLWLTGEEFATDFERA
jgi:hypothetical protein